MASVMVLHSLGECNYVPNNILLRLHDKPFLAVHVMMFVTILHFTGLIISISFGKAFFFPLIPLVFLTSCQFLVFHLLPYSGLHPRIVR